MHLPELIIGIPGETGNNIIFLHDGCPAHHSLNVRQFLHENYRRWIDTGTIAWPAPIPHLFPLDYYVWGTFEKFGIQNTNNL